MKYYQCPVSQAIGLNTYSQNCGVPVSCKKSASLKPVRNVHFPNDIVFQDCVRQGELERIGRFIRAKRVNLDTIYHSGESPETLALRLRSQTLLLKPQTPSVLRLIFPFSPAFVHAGMAAIHEAVLSGNLECVKLLVQYGADLHQRDEEGWTPLHMACSDGFPHIAR